MVQDGGTGVAAGIEDCPVAGKTGTAQKVRPSDEGGGYYAKRFISSFAGFVPAEQPEYAIVVIADDPGRINPVTGRKVSYFGGEVCGPAFGEIATKVLRQLGRGYSSVIYLPGLFGEVE